MVNNSALTPTNLALASRSITAVTFRAEAENAAYGGELLQTSVGNVRVREGRVTPTKLGVFVAVWRRLESGQTGPFPHDDGVDHLLITAQQGALTGSFLIPTRALVEYRIVSVQGRGGKRGFRLYPSWLTGLNPQAARSQAWQAHYFQVTNASK